MIARLLRDGTIIHPIDGSLNGFLRNPAIPSSIGSNLGTNFILSHDPAQHVLLGPPDTVKPQANCGFQCHGTPVEGTVNMGALAGCKPVPVYVATCQRGIASPVPVNSGAPGVSSPEPPQTMPVDQNVMQQLFDQRAGLTQPGSANFLPILLLIGAVFVVACVI